MKLKDFVSNYGYSKEASYVQKYSNAVMPPHVFKVEGRLTYVDTRYIDRYEKAKNNFYQLSQDLYYEIREYLDRDGLLAEQLAEMDGNPHGKNSWNNFLNRILFTTPNKGQYRPIVHRKRYEFIRYTRWLIKREKNEMGNN